MTKDTKNISIITVAVIAAGLVLKLINDYFQPNPLVYLAIPIALFAAYPFIMRYVWKHRSLPTREEIEMAKNIPREGKGERENLLMRLLQRFAKTLEIAGVFLTIMGVLTFIGRLLNPGRVIVRDVSGYWYFAVLYGIFLIAIQQTVKFLNNKFGMASGPMFLIQSTIVGLGYLSLFLIYGWVQTLLR